MGKSSFKVLKLVYFIVFVCVYIVLYFWVKCLKGKFFLFIWRIKEERGK